MKKAAEKKTLSNRKGQKIKKKKIKKKLQLEPEKNEKIKPKANEKKQKNTKLKIKNEIMLQKKDYCQSLEDTLSFEALRPPVPPGEKRPSPPSTSATP